MGARFFLLRRLGILVASACLAAGAAATSEEAFRKGIAAADLKRWAEAVVHFREAVAENPVESEERVFLSGVFSRPYLPRFYLGWALFNQGSDHWEEALEQWEVSERQGVIEKFKRQHQDLVEAREQCNGLLVPAAIAAAAAEISRATELERRVATPFADPALDGDRRAAIAKLADSRRRFETGKAESRLGELRTAASQAGEAADLLAEVADRAQRAESDRLASAAAAARQAIAGAQKAEEDLASLLKDPRRAMIRDERPELVVPADAVSRLRSARAQLDGSASTAEVDAARADAEAATEEFEAVRQEAEQAYAAFVERLRRQAEGGASEVAPRATAALVPRPAELRPPTPTASSAPSGGADENAGEIRRLRFAAERLLGGIGSEDSGSELLETQKSRLTVLVLEARESSVSLETPKGLRDRMSRSLAALQLIAGARSYLTGDADRALEILAAAKPSDERLAAQVHLFAAAARFALHRKGGGAELRRQAAADVRESRALDPRLSPDPRVFSPLFRDFFDS